MDALTGWVLFAGLILAIGALTTRVTILPRARLHGSERPAVWARHVAVAAGVGVCLVLSGLALYFIRQVGEFRDPYVPLMDDVALLLSTRWGSAFKAAAIACFVGLAALGGVLLGRKQGWLIAGPAVLFLGTFPGLTGHASAGGPLSLAADALHVWGAGAWIGGLAVLLYLAWRSDRPSEPAVLESLVPPFSTVAFVAVGTLVVSGAYAAWMHLPAPGALFSSTYGRLLTVKVAVAVVVLAFGARNQRILAPRLSSSDGDRALRASATTELVLAQIVLVITAVLVRTPPP